MFKNVFFILLSIFIFSGCATWDGLKKDSSSAWEVISNKSESAWESTKDASSEAYDSAEDSVRQMTK